MVSGSGCPRICFFLFLCASVVNTNRPILSQSDMIQPPRSTVLEPTAPVILGGRKSVSTRNMKMALQRICRGFKSRSWQRVFFSSFFPTPFLFFLLGLGSLATDLGSSSSAGAVVCSGLSDGTGRSWEISLRRAAHLRMRAHRTGVADGIRAGPGAGPGPGAGLWDCNRDVSSLRPDVGRSPERARVLPVASAFGPSGSWRRPLRRRR